MDQCDALSSSLASQEKFTVEDQIKKECRARGLPEPVTFERLESIPVFSRAGPAPTANAIMGRALKPIHFHRFRNKRGLTQPDTHGSFWRLTFDKPVPGPLALGFGCHYGLGMFKPE